MLAVLGLTLTIAAAPSTADTFLRDYAETRRFLAGRPERVGFAPGAQVAFFLRSGPRSAVQSLYELDLETGQTRELISPASLLRGASETLSAEEKGRLERQRVSARGITAYRVSEDGAQLLVVLAGKPYRLIRSSGEIRAVEVGEGAPALDPQLSPDGQKLAFVQGHDLAVVELESGRRHAVTRGGHEALTRGLAEFVAQEEMGRFSGYVWSPDSRRLAFEEADLSQVERFVVPDLMHPEKLPDAFRYPRPGRANAQVRVGVVSASGGPPRWVSWDSVRYPYLATLKWPKGGPLLLVVQDRAQREELVLAANPDTGETRILWVERDPAWLNLDQAFPLWLGGGKGFLWRTERRGGAELELHGPDGGLLESWIGPEHRLADWVGLDERDPSRPWIYFSVAPTSPESVLMRARPGEAPERIGFQGGPSPVWSISSLSRDGAVLVETQTSSVAMPVTRVRRTDDSSWLELPSVAEAPSRLPRPEVLEVQGYWASVVRPSRLEPGKKLPVIVEVYGGPRHLSVKHSVRESLLSQWLADQGFVVVKLENRGTPNRGREWERAIQGDFSTVPLDDQATALRALATKVPEMDLERVGIEGWSFGGYMSALAVMKKPELFKAAVAGAPVVDWEDYDTHYTERYLGLPKDNVEGYRRSNLLSHAVELTRPLLLVHGTADDNVYFLHSLKLSNALFRAGRPHEFLPLSGLTHMVPEPEVSIRLWERIARFFKENL